MTPERLQQIAELYQAARESTGEERAAVLGRADPEMRREVESLLKVSGGEFPPPRVLEDSNPSSPVTGACLGPYRIESKLGEGGMGEVFRAIDTRLGRAVAIKTTRAEFNVRFEREARAISCLNHPNICTLYDVGPNYLVMELVEGETLAARLKHGPLPIETVLQYGSQIAAAVVEAHSKGIIHRDLKPGNIMIGKTGIKVLDFGLARSGQDETVTASRMMVGTPAYMAPEQREGKLADARTDIYSFGCVLYEMLTGKRAGGQRERIPTRKLENIVSRCLEQDPGRRWQTAVEVQAEIAAVTRGGRGMPRTPRSSPQRAPKVTEKSRIVLGEFENKTADAVFDGILRQSLSVQLEPSRFLTLVSDQQIHQVLRLMKRPPETRLTTQVTQEIAERTGSTAVLEGSVANVGSQYILWLRARNWRTGEILGQEQAQAGSKEEVLNALSQIGVRIRERLGESLADIPEHPTPLEQVTAPSLEALRAYSAARRAVYARGSAAAIPDLRRALAIDPQFPMALADLGFFFWNMGQTDLGAEYVRKAYELIDGVSDRERLFILFLYDRQVTGNLHKELETLEAWAQAYPRDFLPLGLLGGWGTRGTGLYERGLEAAEQALRLNPDLSPVHGNMIELNIYLGRFAEAAAALDRAAERKLELPLFLIDRYCLAFLKGDETGMQREIDRARGNLEAEDWLSHNQALVLARCGQMRYARNRWQHLVERAQHAGAREKAAIYRAAEAVCEAHLGNREQAKERARAAIELARGRDVVYAAGFALGVSGDRSGSQELAEELARRFPEDTPVQFEYLPTLRALFALDDGAPEEAIERLQTALPYDFAMPGTAFFAKFGGLYPAYVRGLAYLEAGRGREAAGEFQKVLDHRGIVLADPIGGLAYLQLGRALVLLGKTDTARSAYQEFLGIWKDADADIPVLKQASAELGRV